MDNVMKRLVFIITDTTGSAYSAIAEDKFTLLVNETAEDESSLQSVLEKNGEAALEMPSNTTPSMAIDTTDSFTSPTVSTAYQVYTDQIAFYANDFVNNLRSLLKSAIDGVFFERRNTATSKYTSIGVNDPTHNTNWKVPARGVDGDYIFAGLDDLLKTRLLIAFDAGNNTVTGTTAETITSSILIPANTLAALCDLYLNYNYEKSTAQNNPIKCYINTVNSLSGATQIATYITGSYRTGGFRRKFLLRGTSLDLQSTNGTTSQLNNWPTDNTFTLTSKITIDPTVDNYILFTCTNDLIGTTWYHKTTTLEMQKLQ